MSPWEIVGLVGGPLLSILTALVVVQMWALKKAHEDGVKEEMDKKTRADVEAAHKRIREEVMPRVDALETARAEDAVRMETLSAMQTEMRGDIKEILSGVQALAVKIAEGPKRGRTA